MGKRLILTACLIVTSFASLLAESSAVDFLRSTGKIYAVVAVIVVIFIGIIMYLISIDRKLTKLENLLEDEQ